MTNPEDQVIAAITDLETSDEPYIEPERCPVCQDDWHGLPMAGCPGAWGTEAQRDEYLARCEAIEQTKQFQAIKESRGDGRSYADPTTDAALWTVVGTLTHRYYGFGSDLE